jgi:putative membrane protein
MQNAFSMGDCLMRPTLLPAVSAVCLTMGVTVLAAQPAPADRPGHESPRAGTNSESMSAMKDSTAGAVGKASAELTTSTKGFATAAATSDLYEVAAGQIAVQRAQSQAVKDFAQKMVDAHSETTAKLKSLVADNKINITLPTHVDHRRQVMLDDLRGAKSQDFDHRYIEQQLAAHKEADILMRGYAKDGDNAAIKEFAATTDRAVKMHLSMAEKLENSAKSASR